MFRQHRQYPVILGYKNLAFLTDRTVISVLLIFRNIWAIKTSSLCFELKIFKRNHYESQLLRLDLQQKIAHVRKAWLGSLDFITTLCPASLFKVLYPECFNHSLLESHTFTYLTYLYLFGVNQAPGILVQCISLFLPLDLPASQAARHVHV